MQINSCLLNNSFFIALPVHRQGLLWHSHKDASYLLFMISWQCGSDQSIWIGKLCTSSQQVEPTLS